MNSRPLAALAGAGLIAAAFPLARYFAAESWSPGAVGFWLLFALPGLALVARAVRQLHPLWLAPLAPLAFALLGLDVTDSSRAVVVTGGYVLALLGVLGAVAAVAVVQRQTP